MIVVGTFQMQTLLGNLGLLGWRTIFKTAVYLPDSILRTLQHVSLECSLRLRDWNMYMCRENINMQLIIQIYEVKSTGFMLFVQYRQVSNIRHTLIGN